MAWHFESDTQRYFENGQFDYAKSDSLNIEVEFVHPERVRVTVGSLVSDLEADFANESHGMQAYVSDDKKRVFQLVTKTGSFDSAEDIQACVLMSPATNNFIMFVCEPIGG